MKNIYAISALSLLLASSQAWASAMDFDSLSTDIATPDITVNNVTVSFTNLMTIAVGSDTYGFGSTYGRNKVSDNNGHFNGNFLTAYDDLTGLGFRTGYFRPNNFVSSILFSTSVSDISFYIADVDAGQGVMISALDDLGSVLHTLSFDLAGGDGLVRLASFDGYSNIRQIQIIGNDPTGIDSLSFNPQAQSSHVPEPASHTMTLLGLGLLGTYMQRRKLHQQSS